MQVEHPSCNLRYDANLSGATKPSVITLEKLRQPEQCPLHASVDEGSQVGVHDLIQNVSSVTMFRTPDELRDVGVSELHQRCDLLAQLCGVSVHVGRLEHFDCTINAIQSAPLHKH